MESENGESSSPRQAVSALLLVVVMTGLTGIIYPLTITGLAQLLFPRRANGSLLMEKGTAVGSALLGQPFSSPRYFWGRPSATPGHPYNGALSGGSNLGPTNPAFLSQVEARIRSLRAADPGAGATVPVDLVTASGSGLDPHISPAAAYYQAGRVARARGLSEESVRAMVERHVAGRQLGFLGEPVVNVLELNLALDLVARPESATR